MSANKDKRRRSLPLPIPTLRGKAAERFLEIVNTPLTEEEIQSLHEAVEWFHGYMDRVLKK